MGFDAKDVAEPLDYDFTYFATRHTPSIPVLANAKGTIPEPSDADVQTLQRQLTKATKAALPQHVNPGDVNAMATAMASLPDDAFAQTEDAILDAFAELCKGQPTREELASLPYRHKRKFLRWLQEQITNPNS